MERHTRIIDLLTGFFRNDSARIQAAALIGSFGRRQGSPASDIDIELLVKDDRLDIDQFTGDVVKLFDKENETLAIKHTLWLADQRKLALYHGSDLLLTELYLYGKKSMVKHIILIC